MALSTSRNRWWRFVPRSRAIGFFSMFASLLLIGVNIGALVTWPHSGASQNALEAFIAVVAVLQFIRSVTGLAALRER